MEYKKIAEGIWEIPKEGGMLVPARIYGTEKIVKAIESDAITQIKNVAYLPGIQKYSIAQPDAHKGYGFCIGGVAGIDYETGVVSPGGVGYDINCIKGKTKILSEDGFKKIKKFEKQNYRITTINNKKALLVFPSFFMKFKNKKLFKVTTELGNSICATREHPFLTLNRMKEIEKIKIGEKVIIFEDNKFIADKIESIKPKNQETVFDFNIQETHNFIANNFVVSNCGVRLIKTNLELKDVKPKMNELVNRLFEEVPSGLGSKGQFKANRNQLNEVMQEGAEWAVREGFGWKKDLQAMEEEGCIELADSSKVSEKAISRGLPQLGSLGSGNHFLEIQLVQEIFDEKTAEKFGLKKGQIVLMAHSGSRGLGHQIASDYLDLMVSAMNKYNIKVPDRQLCCAPVTSKEGQDYLGAMYCAVNYAFANRQMIMHWTRQGFSKIIGRSPEEMEMELLYDVAHNIAKIEEHKIEGIEGKKKKLLVHRKGATRAFPTGRKENPKIYSETGHPAIIPGSMGTASWVVIGTQKGLEETFGSVAHGAGRVMSRNAAIAKKKGSEIQKELLQQGKIVKAASLGTLAEEAPYAYKDVDEVVLSLELSGIAEKVARMTPLGVVKG
ncbi:MAG: RtcB family protein [Candidatus Diapherotrites archaeon]